MTDLKKKRLIIAVTVGAIVLLLFLLTIMIYQLVSIGVENSKEKELKDNIARYERLMEEGSETLERQQLEEWLLRRARELGYSNIDDMILEKGDK